MYTRPPPPTLALCGAARLTCSPHAPRRRLSARHLSHAPASTLRAIDDAGGGGAGSLEWAGGGDGGLRERLNELERARRGGSGPELDDDEGAADSGGGARLTTADLSQGRLSPSGGGSGLLSPSSSSGESADSRAGRAGAGATAAPAPLRRAPAAAAPEFGLGGGRSLGRGPLPPALSPPPQAQWAGARNGRRDDDPAAALASTRAGAMGPSGASGGRVDGSVGDGGMHSRIGATEFNAGGLRLSAVLLSLAGSREEGYTSPAVRAAAADALGNFGAGGAVNSGFPCRAGCGWC